jgi:hypothetical protein
MCTFVKNVSRDDVSAKSPFMVTIEEVIKGLLVVFEKSAHKNSTVGGRLLDR